MEFALWPIALRTDLVRAFRPGESATREGPFRTLRQHGWATPGVPLHIREGGRAAGHVVVFSILNIEAAMCARCGEATTAASFAKAAARIEASATFVRLQVFLSQWPASAVSSLVEGAHVPEDSALALVLRTLALQTATVRLQRRFAKHALACHVGRISSSTEGYVVVTNEGGLSIAVPRGLARAAHRERIGECLAVINSHVDARELIVRAMPGIDVGRDRAEPYSPFARVDGFERINATDAAYLRGRPEPLTIQIPVTIEQ
jgi:hypothetical protein